MRAHLISSAKRQSNRSMLTTLGWKTTAHTHTHSHTPLHTERVQCCHYTVEQLHHKNYRAPCWQNRKLLKRDNIGGCICFKTKCGYALRVCCANSFSNTVSAELSGWKNSLKHFTLLGQGRPQHATLRPDLDLSVLPSWGNNINNLSYNLRQL